MLSKESIDLFNSKRRVEARVMDLNRELEVNRKLYNECRKHLEFSGHILVYFCIYERVSQGREMTRDSSTTI